MTAEIAIVNRQAIALAADSAVTIGRERVWKHSNKLFSPGPNNDIAIMIYGTGEFAGFPWETIIKTFRSELGSKQFDTVKECGAAFQSFLRDARFSPDILNRNMHLVLIVDELEAIKKSLLPYDKKIDFRKMLSDACDVFKSRYEQDLEISPGQTYKDFCRAYGKTLLKNFAGEIFQEVITDGMAEKINRTLYEFARRRVESRFSTGVVIAGYGKKEFFPSIYEYKVDGRDGNFVRSWLATERDLNRDDASKTVVIPFAQADIFYLFMEGISPEYIGFLDKTFDRLLQDKSDRLIREYVADSDARIVEAAKQRRDNKKIVEEFGKEFAAYRYDLIVKPIVQVIRALPKEEMADMALALVELTSLRRKVDSPLESVGGPVDVAVISKGDGLIWMRRKHYFDLDKNKDFLYRKLAMRSRADGQSS